MSDKQMAYIAGMGMVTPIGANVEMTAAAVRAGISGYGVSDFYNESDEPVTMALVPEEFFTDMDIEIDEGDYYGAQHERIIKMAITALREALSQAVIETPVPLILAFPEPLAEIQYHFPASLKSNLLAHQGFPIQKEMFHGVHTGRSAGIHTIDSALRYLYDQGHDYVLIGASDSYFQCPRLIEFDEINRLLSSTNSDGFAPAEGAGFILLTRHIQLAQNFNQTVIGLHGPGTGDEPGHIYSEETYLGDGLDLAFKRALSGCSEQPVKQIYSSMNGEKYWSKEYGVAMMRNKRFFDDNVELEHPADCFGDLGSACGPVLIGLAAKALTGKPSSKASMVYCSSDNANRAALIIEKIPLDMNAGVSRV